MAFDKSKFLDHFRSETREHIQRLSDGLLELERAPERKDVLETMMREAHTIKGSAAMMGFRGLADIAHGMEEGMERALKGELTLDKPHFDLLFRCLDSMEPLLEDDPPPEDRKIEMPVVEQLCRDVEEVFAGKGLDLAGKKRASRPRGRKTSKAGTAPPRGGRKGAKSSGKPKREDSSPPPRRGRAPDMSIRVDIDKLDRLMNLSGEFGIARLRLKEVTGALMRKADRADQMPEEILSLLMDLNGIDEQIGSLTSTLQAEMMDARTVPVSYLFDTFPRAMRDLAQAKGKEVEFEIIGKETQLDKGIIDQLKDPLMHLLRNAVDHGIETPEERRRLGKSEKGRIVLSATQKGSHVTIEVSDDGRGIDTEKVGMKAIERGLIQEDEVDELSSERVYSFLFTPNFTTADTVTETSGRGVGLDVVKDRLNDLKGGVEVSSVRGKGTRFLITLPLTLAITESLLVASGSEIFALPMDSVVETVRVSPEEIRTVGGREVITVRGRIIPLLRLNKVFHLPMKGIVERRYFPVVHVQVLSQSLGLLVDELRGREEIIRKSLGYPLRGNRTFSGVTILGSGRVALILNVPWLVGSMDDALATGQTPHPRHSPRAEGRKILLAEDSLSTATLEKEILESAGYSVVLARDGEEALEKVKQDEFDLIISDVLMPRMDGFELTERLKRSRDHRDIPIVIVTTRESDEDRKRGLDAGADAYILKSEFTSEELLGKIERLVG